MSKQAIYLDDRQRELARRLCDFATIRVNGAVEKSLLSGAEKAAMALAVKWAIEDIAMLRAKFEEPMT
jgi:hypothetical protein